ncbi:MAG: hypothetical protein ABIO70_16095 [Pseudomonadota bacterium]
MEPLPLRLGALLLLTLTVGCDHPPEQPDDTSPGSDTGPGVDTGPGECLLERQIEGVLDADAAVDERGRAAVAFVEAASGDLHLLRCRDGVCGSYTDTVLLDCDPSGCEYPSVAIDPEGRPLVAFMDHAAGAVRVAACDDEACGSSTLRSLAPDTGMGTDITFGPDGLPVVSWGGLSIARCADAACAGAVVQQLDHREGGMPAMALDAEGRPRIAAVTYDHVDGYTWVDCAIDLYVCADAACGAVTTTRFGDCPSPVESPLGMILGADGLPLVALGRDLQICADDACAARQSVTLEQGFTTAVALALDPEGLPVVAYALVNEQFNDATLRVAHCRDPACAAVDIHPWETDVLDVAKAALAIAADGGGALVTTTQGERWDLHLTAWRDAECMP